MKKIIGVMSIFLIGLFLFSIPAYAIPTVSLDTPVFPIYEGDVFDVKVVADGDDPFYDPILDDFIVDEVLAFGFDLDYDSSFFSYNGATVGSSFIDSSFSFPNTDVAGIAFPGLFGDDILLATLSFTAVNAGNGSLGIISDISDLNEGLITWLILDPIDITQSKEVFINPAPVPEPTTLLLLGTGLIGLVGYRRVKK